jgi:hypothetical protein
MLIMMQDDYIKQKYYKYKKTECMKEGMNFLQRMTRDAENRQEYGRATVANFDFSPEFHQSS